MNVLGSQSHLELEVADNPWTLLENSSELAGGKTCYTCFEGLQGGWHHTWPPASSGFWWRSHLRPPRTWDLQWWPFSLYLSNCTELNRFTFRVKVLPISFNEKFSKIYYLFICLFFGPGCQLLLRKGGKIQTGIRIWTRYKMKWENDKI